MSWVALDIEISANGLFLEIGIDIHQTNETNTHNGLFRNFTSRMKVTYMVVAGTQDKLLPSNLGPRACGDFSWGEPEMKSQMEILRQLDRILRDAGDLTDHVVLVGHTISSDTMWLREVGFPKIAEYKTVDIDLIDKFTRKSWDSRKLSTLVEEKGIALHTGHNAGNDAAATLAYWARMVEDTVATAQHWSCWY